MVAETKLLTVGRLAELFRCPVHRIAYLIRARGIRHAARAGRLRLFDTEALRILERELARLDGRPMAEEADHGAN